MASCGGALALGSVVLVGREGVEHYLDMAERFGRFQGTDTVTEWAMFNVRGVVMRSGLDWSGDALLALVWAVAIPLALLAIVAVGRSLKPGQSPDLALGLLALATIVTAYHSHRQTLVFLFVLYAACVGRSLRPGTPLWLTACWMLLVIGVHLWTVYLRNEFLIREYAIQRYQTPVALGLIVVLSLALLLPATARRLAGWPWVWSATPQAAPPGERSPSALPAPGRALASAGAPESST
jgi:hypothetical protein